MLDITQDAFNNAIKDAFESGIESERTRLFNKLDGIETDHKLGNAPGLLFVAIRIIRQRLMGEI
jgi:hypothetical protein